MKSFVIITLFAIVTGTLAFSDLITYHEGCGAKTGVTKETHDAFDVTGEWTEKAKKYMECFLENSGAMIEGKFSEDYKNTLKLLIEKADADTVGKATVTLICIEAVESEGYEGAYEFTACLLGTAYGKALFNIAEQLEES